MTDGQDLPKGFPVGDVEIGKQCAQALPQGGAGMETIPGGLEQSAAKLLHLVD